MVEIGITVIPIRPRIKFYDNWKEKTLTLKLTAFRSSIVHFCNDALYLLAFYTLYSHFKTEYTNGCHWITLNQFEFEAK